MSPAEFDLTWSHGVWRADEQADTFTATWNRCEIVVGFEEETPTLVTAKYLAAHKAA